MKIPRDAFLNHFLPVFQVHCLKLWRQRSKEPPEALPRCLHEWIKTTNGRVNFDLTAFRVDRVARHRGGVSEGLGNRPHRVGGN